MIVCLLLHYVCARGIPGKNHIFVRRTKQMEYTFSQIVEKCLNARRAARYSENTLNDYCTTYKKILVFLDNDPPFTQIDVKTITSFLASQTKVSDKTVLNYHTGLSSLWGWAAKHGYCANNLVRQIQAPKPKEVDITPYTRREVCLLLEACKDGRFPLRDKAVLLMLVDTGVRASEISALNLADMNRIEQYVIVLGKGNKKRRLKFSTSTKDSILTYLKKKRNIQSQHIRKRKHEPLFATKQGNNMKRGTLRLLLHRLDERSGVSNVHAHRFRHTFSIEFLRNGGDIYTLQRMLGHTSLDMVKRYLKIAQVDIDRQHQKASPVRHWNL